MDKQIIIGCKLLSIKKIYSPFFLFVSIMLVTACGSKHLVVLIPDPDGKVGSITVSNEAGSVEISEPNQVAAIQDRETAPASPVEMERKQINSLFYEALAIQPPPPIHFRLYFERNSVQLKSESLAILDNIVAIIRKRYPADVSVVGHTDTVGEKVYNMHLSERRARTVRDLLIETGIPEEQIRIFFRGEENLLIETEDNVANPQNRRAEVTVR